MVCARFVHELSAGQWVMTVALLPLTLWFFGQASLVGAVSNLLAVPFVSFVIVPCALLGTLLLGLCPPLAAPVWWLAGQLIACAMVVARMHGRVAGCALVFAQCGSRRPGSGAAGCAVAAFATRHSLALAGPAAVPAVVVAAAHIATPG